MAKKEFFLVVGAKPSRFNSARVDLLRPKVVAVKGTKTPKLLSNEIAIKMELDLPDAIFLKTQYRASVKVDEESVASQVVSASVISDIEDIITEQTGLQITLEGVQVFQASEPPAPRGRSIQV